MEFSSTEAHRDWLKAQSDLPTGFRVGTAVLSFMPEENPKPSKMNLTLLALEESTSSFSGLFTQNAFPGAPVILGRERARGESVRALLINNKVSNVGVKTGLQDAEMLCTRLGELLGCSPQEVIPSSTGVIGWRLPVSPMEEKLPELLESQQAMSIYPAAEAIMTTDLYPKVRRVELGGGSIVGIAKGAGMIEPNLATMLAFFLTDIEIGRGELTEALRQAVGVSFNAMSIDGDQSTSDTVIAVSSNRMRGVSSSDFAAALRQVSTLLAQDVVRNGEGVHHVIEVHVTEAPSFAFAKGVGKAVINSPLVKTAICGNDSNVGRFVMALGNFRDHECSDIDFSKVTLILGGERIFSHGSFELSPEKEEKLTRYMKEAEMYTSVAPDERGVFCPMKKYPVHERNVQLKISLGHGSAEARVWGGDLTHEYISENADYRS